jgi:hypothetical protein
MFSKWRKMMKLKIIISPDHEIEKLLLQRGDNPSIVGLRDLRRYYALLNHHLLELNLTTDEANLICEVLKDYRLEEDPERGRAIWKQINNAIPKDQLVGVPTVGNHQWKVNSAFIGKIKALTHFQSFALVDAVERYWIWEQSSPDEPIQTKLSRVDLHSCCNFAL